MCVGPLVVFLIDSPVPPSIQLLKSLQLKEVRPDPPPLSLLRRPARRLDSNLQEMFTTNAFLLVLHLISGI